MISASILGYVQQIYTFSPLYASSLTLSFLFGWYDDSFAHKHLRFLHRLSQRANDTPQSSSRPSNRVACVVRDTPQKAPCERETACVAKDDQGVTHDQRDDTMSHELVPRGHKIDNRRRSRMHSIR